MIPVVIITLSMGLAPDLPVLSDTSNKLSRLLHPVTPTKLTPRDLKKYKGFTHFLDAKKKNDSLVHAASHALNTNQIRAAFYVDWDPQAFFSLRKNVSKLNMVVPEWFFINPKTDALEVQIDTAALHLMQKNNVTIIPLINNVSLEDENGDFNSDILHAILNDPQKQERLILDIVKYLRQYHLQGINVDFEALKEKSQAPIIAFQKHLYAALHSQGFLVTQDIVPDDEDYNIKELAVSNDYIFLMAYDEHYVNSVPGPVSSQKWIEKVLDEAAASVDSKKIILSIAGYGYDWAEGDEGITVTYQQALANAEQHKAVIQFDDDNYNNYYSYKDADSVMHNVYFTDAATNFNTMRFADEYRVAGTALWRMGSEDERLWTFYNRSLDNRSIRQKPFDFSLLQNVNIPTGTPDYIGDGEILNVLTSPTPGKIHIELDTAASTVSEEQYLQLPTTYVIKKYGIVHNQVLLTFDDGPDPTYTPQILDILKKENVPAAFFVVGIQAENNLPLLKDIYRDGFEIGNHTFTHPDIASVSPDRALNEIETTRLLIEAATGRSTVLFRAPFNADAEPSTEAELRPIALSKEKNYYTVGESIDPEDWEPGVTADEIYKRVVSQYEAHPDKGIILLHDAGGNRQATVDALPKIIHYFKSRNVQFISVSSLLHTTKDVVMPVTNNGFVALNGEIASVGYWLICFITAAFWVAIFLGLARIAIMAIMALADNIKNKILLPVSGIVLESPPFVSIIIPAYNEEVNAVKTIRNLLQQDYPAFNIVFVDDGSADNTYNKVYDAFKDHKNVLVLTKPNGGKASALNYGISQTASEFVICIDADTQLKSDAISELMKKMLMPLPKKNQMVGAVAGNVKVGNEKTMLTRWQSIEYTTAQNFDRRALDFINGITVVPGAIGAFRKKAIEDAGGFTSDTLAEDCDITIRILRKGYRVVNCTSAIAVTEAPETLKQFMKQRFRWSYGIMQAFWKNKDVCFNPSYKGLGLFALPNILLFQIILPIVAPLADVMLIVSLIWNRNDPDSMHKIGFYYLVFFAVDILVSIIAFAFEREKLSKLFWLIPQRLVYRQLMYVILFRSIRKALKGESQEWGILKRTGNVNKVFEPEKH
jgi:cellulose synthase/poly-beta-1,6-N-acetylglucosamine synthase-like glycosyltransferase/spore germination protein YaaH/peptidoglycan/xylan/chitin deacetylase (PgdA/CDA1 family)